MDLQSFISISISISFLFSFFFHYFIYFSLSFGTIDQEIGADLGKDSPPVQTAAMGLCGAAGNVCASGNFERELPNDRRPALEPVRVYVIRIGRLCGAGFAPKGFPIALRRQQREFLFGDIPNNHSQKRGRSENFELLVSLSGNRFQGSSLSFFSSSICFFSRLVLILFLRIWWAKTLTVLFWQVVRKKKKKKKERKKEKKRKIRGKEY